MSNYLVEEDGTRRNILGSDGLKKYYLRIKREEREIAETREKSLKKA